MNLWNLHVKRGPSSLYVGQVVAKTQDAAIELARKRAADPVSLGRPFGFARIEATEPLTATACNRR